jgi:hypothetical protein
MHLTLAPVVQIATLGTLVTGLVSLVVWARIYRRQVNAQILIAITARYTSIFQSFPARLWLAQLDSDQPLPERRCGVYCTRFSVFHDRRFRVSAPRAAVSYEGCMRDSASRTSTHSCQSLVRAGVERD